MNIFTANTNPETRIPYGYVAANDLDPDLVQTLMEVGEYETMKEAEYEAAMEFLRPVISDEEHQSIKAPEEGGLEQAEQLLMDYDLFSDYARGLDMMETSEPLIHGVYEEVHYMTSWLGGALHFFITQSPHITQNASKASPCVPNAGILSGPDDGNMGEVEAYTVPNDWWLDTSV